MTESPVGGSWSASVTGDVHGHLIVGTGNQIVEDAEALLGPPAAVVLAGVVANLPKRPAKVFVGREEALADLDEGEPSSSSLVTRTVHGMGGVGKTELVLHYAHREFDRHPIVWWITADAPDRIDAGLAGLTAAIAARVGRIAPLAMDAADWAVELLRSHPGWLLVLDNVEDPADVEPLLARLSGGRVLITSRRDIGWEHTVDRSSRLDLLDEDAAVRVLVARAGSDDPEAVRALAAELGFLPLALTQAGAYLAQTRTSARAYLDRLRDAPGRMLAAGTAERTVARVWDISLAAVEAADPFAIDVLRVLAAYAPDGVPRDLLAAMGPGADAALGLLGSYHMISLDERVAGTHRLVRAVVIDRAADAWPGCRRRAAELIVDAIPDGDPARDVAAWPRWAALVPHIRELSRHWPDDEPDATLAELLSRASSYLAVQGAYAVAVDLDARACAMNTAALGPDHPNTLNSRGNLAAGYRDIGRLDEAIALDERTLADRERVLGPDHPDTLHSRGNLALGYRTVGRLDEAIALDERTLADRERILGPDHPDTLSSRNNLSGAYWDAGRLDESNAMDERTLADRERILGPDHPDALRSRHNLAIGYRATGRIEEAIALDERTLAGRERVLGPDHPDTLHSRHLLAVGYYGVGRLAEAIRAHETNLAACARVLADGDRDLLVTRDHLSAAYWDADRRAESIALDEESLAVRIRVFGPDHPDTRASRENLVAGYRAVGRLREADELAG